ARAPAPPVCAPSAVRPSGPLSRGLGTSVTAAAGPAPGAPRRVAAAGGGAAATGCAAAEIGDTDVAGAVSGSACAGACDVVWYASLGGAGAVAARYGRASRSRRIRVSTWDAAASGARSAAPRVGV